MCTAATDKTFLLDCHSHCDTGNGNDLNWFPLKVGNSVCVLHLNHTFLCLCAASSGKWTRKQLQTNYKLVEKVEGGGDLAVNEKLGRPGEAVDVLKDTSEHQGELEDF